MRLRHVVSLLAVQAAFVACASGGSSSGATNTGTTTPRRGSASVITEAEIASTGLESLYDVVERLRPNMMRARGTPGRLAGATDGSAGATAPTIKVYLNGTPIGDLTALRTIQASNVKEVKYLSASEATTFFGTGVDSGAIVVTLK